MKFQNDLDEHKGAFSTLVECLYVQMTHLLFTNFLENWLSYSLKCVFQKNNLDLMNFLYF